MDYTAIAAHCADSLAVGSDSPVDGWGPCFYLLENANVPLDAWRDVGEGWQPVSDDDYDPCAELPDGFEPAYGMSVVGDVLCVVGTDGMCMIHWRFERRA